MTKEYKNTNNSFCEHFKLYGYLSPTMIEELLDERDKLESELEEADRRVYDTLMRHKVGKI